MFLARKPEVAVKRDGGTALHNASLAKFPRNFIVACQVQCAVSKMGRTPLHVAISLAAPSEALYNCKMCTSGEISRAKQFLALEAVLSDVSECFIGPAEPRRGVSIPCDCDLWGSISTL